MKVIAMVAVFSYCTYLGYSKGKGLDQRTHMLRMVLEDLCKIRLHLRYGQLPLDRLLFENAAEQNLLFKEVAAEIARGISPSQAFEHVLQGQIARGDRGVISLKNDDIKNLRALFSTLGAMDADSQCRQIELLENTLQAALETAKEENKCQGKLFRSLGLMAGTAFAILLI